MRNDDLRNRPLNTVQQADWSWIRLACWRRPACHYSCEKEIRHGVMLGPLYPKSPQHQRQWTTSNDFPTPFNSATAAPYLHWCRSILTGGPVLVSVSAEYVRANSHQRHSGALVVTFGVERLRQEMVATGSKTQYPSLSPDFNGPEVIWELPWATGRMILENLGTGNDRVFCRKIVIRVRRV